MSTTVRRIMSGMVFAMVCVATTGCQTYQLGQVLPTPYFMRDDIQYFPKGPQHPLANELNAMQAAEAEHQAGER